MADSYHQTSQTERPLGFPPARVKTNGLAIASLVLGILWLYWIGSILALIFGYLALRQIRRSDGWQDGRGLAIAGIVLGWVGAGVLAIVLALAIAVANVDDDETGRAPAQSTVTSVSSSTVPPATRSAGVTGNDADEQSRPPAEVTVRVANSSGIAGIAALWTSQIGDAGYQLVDPINAQQVRATTAVLFADGFAQEATSLAAAIGAPRDGVVAMTDPPQVDPGGANLVVLIGTDLANG